MNLIRNPRVFIFACPRHPVDGPVSGHRQVGESVENKRDAFRATRSASLRDARGHFANDRLLLLTSLSYEETKMGSKTQKTEIIRHRKHAPNKINRKTEQKQVRRNLDLLVKLKNEDGK